MHDSHPAGYDLRSVVLAAAALRGIYTEARLAEVSGITTDTMQRWWRLGSVPSPDSIAQLAAALELDQGVLLEIARGGPVRVSLAFGAPGPVVGGQGSVVEALRDIADALRELRPLSEADVLAEGVRRIAEFDLRSDRATSPSQSPRSSRGAPGRR